MSELPPSLEGRERSAFEPERVLAAAVLGAICVISLANVVVRYFTNISFAATEEISIALMVVLAFLGSAAAFARNRHIAVTILADNLPDPFRRAARMLVQAAILTMFAILTWYGARLAWDEYRFEVTSPSLGWPQWTYTIWLPLLSAYIFIRAGWAMLARAGR